jgi:hypothetical protein
MYDVIYKNNYKEDANLTKWPYMITGGDIFDGKWEAIENDEHIQGFEKNIQERKIQLTISSVGMQSLASAIDKLEGIIEKDIISAVPGRLYVGNSYMNCYISDNSKDRWVNDIDSITMELKVMSDYPYWITESLYQFRKSSEPTSEGSEIGIDYEYDYEYEYCYGFGSDGTMQYINNANPTECGFRMIIYGPVINPAIRISGHLYELKTTLYDGEYAVIDCSTRYSQDRAIYKIQNDGIKVDLFNSRNKQSEIWKKIPPGRSTVTWTGNFGFDVVLFGERGTPPWTLSAQT